MSRTNDSRRLLQSSIAAHRLCKCFTFGQQKWQKVPVIWLYDATASKLQGLRQESWGLTFRANVKDVLFKAKALTSYVMELWQWMSLFVWQSQRRLKIARTWSGPSYLAPGSPGNDTLSYSTVQPRVRFRCCCLLLLTLLSCHILK